MRCPAPVPICTRPRPGTVDGRAAVLRDVLVVSASAGDGDAVATLRVPERLVPVLVAAEGRSSLRLVVRAPEQM